MTVYRSEEVTLDELAQKHPNMTHLVISPGPGHPLRDSGISIPAIKAYAGKVPILGVCMGLQSICAAYGGEVDVAGEVVHGKTSAVQHDGRGLFKGVTQGIQATRYHSLAARLNSIPDELEVTSRTQSGIIMGLRHKEFAVEAVQYHPESILSEEGQVMLANFLSLKSGTWAGNPGFEDAGIKTQANGIHLDGKTNGVLKAAAGSLPTILHKITEQRIQDVARAKATPGSTPADLASLISLHVAPPLISFHRRLGAPNGSTGGQHMALLAEIKRASPSKGDIVDASSPSSPAIALSYAHAGASVISVLTEPKWFKGSLDDMRAVRAAIDSLPNRPAVLRKDFILDTYQIDEARVYGADTVLLIVAMLTDEKLRELYDYSLSRGMEPLVEVNNADELSRALRVGAKVIGVNNRNLHDFNVDMGTTTRVADAIKESNKNGNEVILIALSGITGRQDVERYAEQGVSAVLVGESLMRANDKPAFVRHLLGLPEPVRPYVPSSPSIEAQRRSQTPSELAHAPLVKICGIRTKEAALAATEAGADMLGFIFAPRSKRYVEPEAARDIGDAVRTASRRVDKGKTPARQTDDWFGVQTSTLALKRKPLLVGVFQNASLENILDTVDTVGLDVVQLHGDEPLSWTRLMPVPVMKAFHVDSTSELSGDGQTEEALRDASRPGYHAVALLDTKVGSGKGALSGGAGRTFDWSVARRLVEADLASNGGRRLPIVLAGGLDVTNVQQAVEQVRPWAIDVSGGVETDGQKDLDKIRELLKAVKASSTSA